jgi:hypothetical protein
MGDKQEIKASVDSETNRKKKLNNFWSLMVFCSIKEYLG